MKLFWLSLCNHVPESRQSFFRWYDDRARILYWGIEKQRTGMTRMGDATRGITCALRTELNKGNQSLWSQFSVKSIWQRDRQQKVPNHILLFNIFCLVERAMSSELFMYLVWPKENMCQTKIGYPIIIFFNACSNSITKKTLLRNSNQYT